LIPEHIKTFFLRDIKILHEEDANKELYGTTSRSTSRASFLKKKRQSSPYKFILHPESQYRLFWDIVTALLVVILIWLIPFYIGFDTWSSEKMNALSVFMDVWFICDVFLNFRTGFVDHGATVMDTNKIAKHYFKSWFIIDFVASVPWEIFVGEDQATGSKTANKASRKSVKMSKYFKIPKLLRMARLLRAFNKYARFYALTLVILGMIVTVHVGACLIAKVLEICTEEFWVDLDNDGNYAMVSNLDQNPCEDNSVFNLYAEAIYVCFALMLGMSPAGGTLGAAAQIKEKGAVTITKALQSYTDGSSYASENGYTLYLLTVFLMTGGMFQMSMVVGHVGLLLRDRHLASAVFRSKLDRVKEELKYYGVPWVLQNRVLAYYDYMWVNQKQYDDKITLLTDKGMSSDLRGKLALHMYKDVVQGVSLFSRVDDTFLSKVCMELQTRVFLPGDWIILKGDIGSELYIISRGVCQVFLRDPWEIVTHGDVESEKEILLSNGQFFGEISLLMEVRRTTSVQAKTICEVNVLVQEVFEEILRESPDFADEMKTLIVKRKIENFKKLHNTHASMEERELIEDAVNEAIESRQLMIGDYAERGDEEDDAHSLPGVVPDTSHKQTSLPVRLSQAGRTPSGIALNNMGGTGFMKEHKMQLEAHSEEHLQPINEGKSSSNIAVSPTSKLRSAMIVSPTNPNINNNNHQQQQVEQAHFSRDMSSHRQGTSRDMYEVAMNELNNDDVVSQQLGLLQERIDKIYAMLTTKLGRVR